ncbi:hypothetical protein ACFQ67_00145 [Streptomyces sp. NPDC056488]|uniref:hypothetical protein n=1 Tax=Streptomyces sp. NPDC056488 TaxID=3345836 RepID=UPI00368C8A3F
MPLYERRDESHEVVERILTVPGSGEDQRLAAAEGVWKLVEDEPEQQAPAAPAPLPRRTSKPAAPVPEG